MVRQAGSKLSSLIAPDAMPTLHLFLLFVVVIGMRTRLIGLSEKSFCSRSHSGWWVLWVLSVSQIYPLCREPMVWRCAFERFYLRVILRGNAHWVPLHEGKWCGVGKWLGNATSPLFYPIHFQFLEVALVHHELTHCIIEYLEVEFPV